MEKTRRLHRYRHVRRGVPPTVTPDGTTPRLLVGGTAGSRRMFPMVWVQVSNHMFVQRPQSIQQAGLHARIRDLEDTKATNEQNTNPCRIDKNK